MFSKILSYSNFKAAYLEIIEQFAADRRNYKYHGLDNVFLHDFDIKSKKIIDLARMELRENKKIEPALSFKIAKKNKPNEYREIFVYNLKERIKAQAIYRVVLPEFEKLFSNRLFSYRPGKPPYLAARIFCRRYRKDFLTDYALIIDLKNYSDRINRVLMFSKLKNIFADQKLLSFFRLFIFNEIYRAGKFINPSEGLVQGVPLIAIFANLYLTDFDRKYQRRSDFYIRVGDDIAFFDKDQEKLRNIMSEISVDLDSLGLEINKKKLFFGPASDSFSYLGYSFHNGIISLEPAFVKKIESEWKKILINVNLPYEAKRRIFKRIMTQSRDNLNYQFENIIKDKPQINNSAQVKKISEKFFLVMTKFFYNRYSARNRRLLEETLAEFSLNSIYKVYQKFHYEKH